MQSVKDLLNWAASKLERKPVYSGFFETARVDVKATVVKAKAILQTELKRVKVFLDYHPRALSFGAAEISAKKIMMRLFGEEHSEALKAAETCLFGLLVARDEHEKMECAIAYLAEFALFLCWEIFRSVLGDWTETLQVTEDFVVLSKPATEMTPREQRVWSFTEPLITELEIIIATLKREYLRYFDYDVVVTVMQWVADMKLLGCRRPDEHDAGSEALRKELKKQ